MSKPVIKKSQVKLWFLIPFIMFLAFIVMLFFRLGKPTEVIPSNVLNKPVPAFSLPLLLDTEQTVTNSNLPKQPFLLNVWGSWCPTCKVEHPYLMQLHEQGVPIVGVNYKDELGNALSYLNERGDPFLLSIQDLSGGFAIDLGLTGAPETFIVDKTGNIRQHIVGEINADNWQSRIQPCMNALDNEAEETVVAEVCQ